MTGPVYEVKLWVAWFLKGIPGQIGCWLRRSLLPGAYGPGVQIWEGVQIDFPSRLTVGARTSINRGCVLHCGGHVEIGEDVLIGPSVIIYSQNHEYRAPDRKISEQGYRLKKVVIGRGAWIAARAVVLPGVEIGEGAVVAAGAVVTRSVPRQSVVAGCPAREIAVRR